MANLTEGPVEVQVQCFKAFGGCGKKWWSKGTTDGDFPTSPCCNAMSIATGKARTVKQKHRDSQKRS